MKNKHYAVNLKMFLWGLGVFVVSVSTVALVTDPYVMADIALVILGMYLMFVGLTAHKVDGG